MTTSGTYAFALQADDLLTEAWERCGLNAEVLTSVHARSAMRSLSLALLAWTNAGMNLWQVDRQTISQGAGVASFTTAVATTDLLEVFASVNGQDLQLGALGRQEWMAISTKAATGRPTSYWVERITPVPIVHLWPVPDVSYSMTYSRIRQPQDLSLLFQTADAPTLWLDALAAELAARLAVKWAPDRVQGLRPEADRSFVLAAGENRERVPFKLTPVLG